MAPTVSVIIMGVGYKEIEMPLNYILPIWELNQSSPYGRILWYARMLSCYLGFKP